MIKDEIDEAVGKKVRIAIGAFFVFLAIYLFSAVAFSLWPFSSITRVIGKTTSAEAVIANYQWFYDQYAAIEAQKANINALPTDAPELVGLRMVLNSSIAEYNSRSRQIHRELWKGKDLPYQINMEEYR